jgi:hypothetical protein
MAHANECANEIETKYCHSNVSMAGPTAHLAGRMVELLRREGEALEALHHCAVRSVWRHCHHVSQVRIALPPAQEGREEETNCKQVKTNPTKPTAGEEAKASTIDNGGR